MTGTTWAKTSYPHVLDENKEIWKEIKIIYLISRATSWFYASSMPSRRVQ
jgi:hypothetical protein